MGLLHGTAAACDRDRHVTGASSPTRGKWGIGCCAVRPGASIRVDAPTGQSQKACLMTKWTYLCKVPWFAVNVGFASCAGQVNSGGVSSATGGSTAVGSDATGSTGATTANSTSSTIASGTAVAVDVSVLSRGDNNAVSTGGYWWTYTDHNSNQSSYHAKVSPVTSVTVALQPEVNSDPTHGNVLRVYGTVPAALPWELVALQDPSTIDTYWQNYYPDSMIPAYPAAGIGFGFANRNAPFDATGGGKWIGIAFDMKVSVDTPVVWVSMPMVGTDLPDPQIADAFPMKCKYYTATNTPVDGGSNCFAYHRKGIFSDVSTAGTPTAFNTLASIGSWKRFCVLYSEVAIPNWANAVTVSMMPGFDPTQLLKVSWDMYQPNTGADVATFDVSLDNVQLLNEAQARDAANNCDTSMIGMPPGSGNAG